MSWNVLAHAFNMDRSPESRLGTSSCMECKRPIKDRILKLTYLLQLGFHARHEHDAGDAHAQEHEEGVDQPGDGGVVSTWATSAQQARSAATKAGNLKRRRFRFSFQAVHSYKQELVS